MKTTIITFSYWSVQVADRIWFRLERRPSDESANVTVYTSSDSLGHGSVDRNTLLHMRDTLNEVLADWQP